ncbi:MAG: hypothetical protein RLY14_1669 [Planctomycetota bacterium]|jgi:hypothetical protein
MHRIRLSSQWQGKLAEAGIVEASRNFHAPSNLTPNARVFFVGTSVSLPLSITMQLNDTPSINLPVQATISVELTSNLRRFNQITWRITLPPDIVLPSPYLAPWPLENIALEIHSD